jgi:oxygen-independent coproporphyrinogen III oxidase
MNYDPITNKCSLYIHIPFCERICPYCDFNVTSGKKVNFNSYNDALKKEICFKLNSDYSKNVVISTVYFGGGTPSILPSKLLAEILEIIPFSKSAEITIEVNPEHATDSFFKELSQIGFNRISLGIQSFDNKTLKTLGRKHTAEISVNAVNLALANFDNVSIDLIYGSPNQSLIEFKNDLLTVVKFNPSHISLYELTIEFGTVMYQKKERNILGWIDEEIICNMMEYRDEVLELSGYYGYEISNYSRNNFKSKHNLQYWESGDYLGIGAGAHSCIYNKSNAKRSGNIKSVKDYQAKVNQNLNPECWIEDVSGNQLLAEYLMLRFRLTEGISLSEIISRFEVDITSKTKDFFADWHERGYLNITEKFIGLTPKGKCFYDSFIEELGKVILE